ncbi:RNA-directed DNA polymerase, eukaryota, reverse transcriptase zinc-binding domain protein [Tanacetum coccineum]
MSNKKRLPKHKPRIPNKFNGHIMSDLSQKRKNTSEVDDIDEIRASMDDKVENNGEIGKKSKEVAMEEIECVNELVHEDNEEAISKLKNINQESEVSDKELNKGVFGSADAGVKNVVDSVEVEGEGGKDQTEGLKVGSPKPLIQCTIDDYNHVLNESQNYKSNDEPNMKSYANKLTNGMNTSDNELFFVPTIMNGNGEKVVIFDEELVKEGSEKWKYTVCGYFVGYKMDINKLRYNTRRMWGKLGLKDSIVDAEGMCYFKFKNEEGMNYVIDQSPWLIRLVNIPLEAWSIRGISALASRLRRPIKMDQVTADMCRTGTGRLGYARVLIETNAEDEFPDKIEINYVDDKKKVKSTKWVKVEYTWKPDRYSHCKVFGYSVYNCDKQPKPKPAVHKFIRPIAGEKNVAEDKEGFVDVLSRRNNNRRVWNKENPGIKQQPVGVKVAYRPKANVEKTTEVKQNKPKESTFGVNKEPKVWNVDDENNNEVDPFLDKRLIVDEFIKKKQQPNCAETKDWNYDMINYFKVQWEAMERKNMQSSDEEDVFENIDQATQSFIADELMEKTPRNAGGFIVEERVQVCKILETHLKTKNISKACDYVFGRIVVGWNADEVDIMVVQSCSQTVLYLVEIAQTKVKFFVSFVYASNSCVERRSLWNELNMHKCSVNQRAWVLMGDFNVTHKPEEHSNGSSHMSIDMHDFNDAVNTMEVEDICSSGFHFTWTKSLKNAMCSTLKKLDRIMINENFLMQFEKAHGIFLPYLVSDHCPAIMTIPKGISKKKKSFRFANYVADKKDFLDVVREGWKQDVRGKVDADPSNLEKRKNSVNIMNEYTQVAEDELKLLHQKAKLYGDIVVLKLSKEEANDMIKNISDKEIKDALFDIDSNKKSLDEFSSVSGLFPNLSKSTIFFGSVNEKVKEDMLKILPFKCGKLPMRYLGVPLLAKRLGVKDCQNLLDNVKRSVKGKLELLGKFVCRPKEQEVEAMEDGNGLINGVIGTLLLINLQSLLYLWKKTELNGYVRGINPKQVVILWMAIQRKLMTQDRMCWMHGDTLKCSLCNGCADSHDHLFFGCIFSKKVWGKLMAKGKIRLYSHSLNNIVMHLAANPHKSKIWQIVNKLILSSLLLNIADILKCLKVKKSTAVLNVAKQWDLKWDEGKLIAEIGDQRS